MKILEPTSLNIYDGPGRCAGKYHEIVEKVAQLKADEWLPIEFDSSAEAEVARNRILQALRSGVHRLHPVKLTTCIRGSVLYFRPREESKP